jgi:hypothetical protein
MILAEHKVTSAAPLVARVLTSPYPLARRFAAQALSMLRAERCDIDVDGTPEELRKAIIACGLAADPVIPRAPAEHSGESGDED